MTLIALVVAFSLEWFATQLQAMRSLAWFERYAGWARGRFGSSAFRDGPLGVLAILLGPLLVLGLVQAALAGVWLGLLSLLLGIAVLFYCLRFQGLDRQVEAFVDAAEGGDTGRARELAAGLLERSLAEDESEVRQVTAAVLVQANERLFAVVFWFAVLGPLGAFLYRLSWYLAYRTPPEDAEAGFIDAALRLHGILAWVPARLTALGYALAGSFEDGLQEWRNVYQTLPEDFVRTTEVVLRQTGVGALRLERYLAQQEDEGVALEPSVAGAARGLVLRTLVLWAIAIALLTLAGWVR